MKVLFAGIDWGHEHVQFVVENEEGAQLWRIRAEARPVELSKALAKINELRGQHGADRVVAGVELSGGRLVEMLLGVGFDVWFIRPEQVDEARKLVFASTAKDDLRDARTMAWILRSLPKESLIRVERPTVEVVELKRLTRSRANLVADQTAARNQLISLLREFFPELLDVAGPDCRWFRELVRLMGTPQRARGVPLAEIRALLKRYRVRRTTAEKIQEDLLSAETIGDFGDWALEVDQLLGRLDLFEAQIAALEERIADRVEKLHQADLDRSPEAEKSKVSDVQVLRSLPGVGDTIVAVMLGERLPELVRANLELARALTGVAPVLQTTGKKQTHRHSKPLMRRACSNHLRNAMHLFVEKGMQNDLWMAARYAQLRGRGHSHGRACRQLGDQMLTRLAAMLRDRSLYEPPPVLMPGVKLAKAS